MELLGHRQQGLAQERELVGPDGDLAGPRPLHGPGHRDLVAQVQQLGQGPGLLVEGVLAQGDLDLTRLVAEVGEDHLAHVADEDESPGRVAEIALQRVCLVGRGGLDGLCPALGGLPLNVLLGDSLDGLGRVVAAAVGVDPQFANLFELVEPVGLYLVQHGVSFLIRKMHNR